MLRYLLLIVLVVFTGSVFAQSKKKKKNNEVSEATGPSSLTPYYPHKASEPKKKKKGNRKVTYDAREKFYDRLEEVAKAHRKAEKELEKPQYSDPLYFGHKRPPKKRPPGKMKYCKVCGLRH